MSKTMPRMIIPSVLLAAAGLAMLIAGFGSDEDSPLYVLRWLGVLGLAGGVLLAVLAAYFFWRE